MIYITIVAGIFLAEFFGKSYIEKHKKEGKACLGRQDCYPQIS